MKENSNRKKIIVGLAIVGAIALAGLQTAGAGQRGGGSYGWGGGPQCNDCGYGYGYQGHQQLDEKTVKAQDKFMNETVQMRKDMATKRAEKHALMRSDNPDAKRVAQLTGELFDLRDQLRTKAEENGLENTNFKGKGFGRGQGMDSGGDSGRGCNGPGLSGYYQNRF